jgi:hypothetical protein
MEDVIINDLSELQGFEVIEIVAYENGMSKIFACYKDGDGYRLQIFHCKNEVIDPNRQQYRFDSGDKYCNVIDWADLPKIPEV